MGLINQTLFHLFHSAGASPSKLAQRWRCCWPARSAFPFPRRIARWAPWSLWAWPAPANSVGRTRIDEAVLTMRRTVSRWVWRRRRRLWTGACSVTLCTRGWLRCRSRAPWVLPLCGCCARSCCKEVDQGSSSSESELVNYYCKCETRRHVRIWQIEKDCGAEWRRRSWRRWDGYDIECLRWTWRFPLWFCTLVSSVGVGVSGYTYIHDTRVVVGLAICSRGHIQVLYLQKPNKWREREKE